MSLGSLLSIAKGALMTHQKALNVTGHNIANATTPGYTRQRLELAAETPLRTPDGTIGRGVTDQGIFATRSRFLDASYRREAAGFSHADTLRDLMGRVEQVFGEPSETGLAASLDAFFGSFSDLANDPASLSSRAAVQQSGQQLVRQIRTIDSRIDEVNQTVVDTFRDVVTQVNSIAQQIGTLNQQIVVAGGPQHTAPDLEDARGKLLDQLAGFGSVRVIDHDNGAMGVVFGDTLLVDGTNVQVLDVRTPVTGGVFAGVVGEPRNLAPIAGSLAALSELAGQALPSVRSELDRLVNALVTQVNAIHAAGTTPGGVTNTNFFNPAGTTANNFALAANIIASPANIVAGTTAAAGDNVVALQLAGLRTTAIASLNSSTPGEFYTGLVSSVGSIVRDATQESDAAEALSAGTAARRSSITGVSTDEEMVALMVHQQAFAAASRLVKVADDMMQTLLTMV